MTTDEIFMWRALDLARLGEGNVIPNPMVGAVVVHKGRIIGEGYHRYYGQPHAEVEAIGSVADPKLLSESTLYVTLEPCAHYGKTPPCAELIIRSRIPKVVIAMQDPYHEVAGKGIRMLEEAGITTVVGVLEAEALALNAPFIRMNQEHRPYIVLKWAESADGYLDAKRSDDTTPPVLFSSPEQQRMVHARRMGLHAILIGYRTALLDDPSLTNRYWYGRSPIRIVLDRDLRLPHSLRLFTDRQSATWVLYDRDRVSSIPEEDTPHLRYIPISWGDCWARSVTDALYAQGVQSVLVEGGGKTLQGFIDAGLFDEISREVSSLVLGDGVPAPHLRTAREYTQKYPCNCLL